MLCWIPVEINIEVNYNVVSALQCSQMSLVWWTEAGRFGSFALQSKPARSQQRWNTGRVRVQKNRLHLQSNYNWSQFFCMSDWLINSIFSAVGWAGWNGFGPEWHWSEGFTIMFKSDVIISWVLTVLIIFQHLFFCNEVESLIKAISSLSLDSMGLRLHIRDEPMTLSHFMSTRIGEKFWWVSVCGCVWSVISFVDLLFQHWWTSHLHGGVQRVKNHTRSPSE